MRTYEVMFIVRPDLADEDLDKLMATLEGNVATAGGTLKNTERMGKRRLAYSLGKFNDGNYMLFNIEGEGKMIAEVERRMRVAEPVLKYITVRVDEKQKRLAKIQAIRATKVRRPQASASEPAAASPAAPSEPAPASA